MVFTFKSTGGWFGERSPPGNAGLGYLSVPYSVELVVSSCLALHPVEGEIVELNSAMLCLQHVIDMLNVLALPKNILTSLSIHSF